MNFLCEYHGNNKVRLKKNLRHGQSISCLNIVPYLEMYNSSYPQNYERILDAAIQSNPYPLTPNTDTMSTYEFERMTQGTRN
jgi:hypothetical protein